MKAVRLAIADVILFEPKIFDDERGFFFESFNQKVFEQSAGLGHSFVQDNHSKSMKGVLRGLHYQLAPMAQGKLIRVVQGEIFDVAVDIRKASPAFGRWVGEKISAENRKQIWIPEGFAHGFIALSDTAEVVYKATNYYAPESERCIRWDDPKLAIDWQVSYEPNLSPKDGGGVSFEQAEAFT